MSCTDKLIKWSVLGLQGSVLGNLFTKPILLASLVFSDEGFTSADISRLRSRIKDAGGELRVDVVSETFPFSKAAVQASGFPFAPCDCAICWYAEAKIHYHSLMPQASIVNGVKQGFNVKKLSDGARTCICRSEMRKTFVETVEVVKKREFEVGFSIFEGVDLKALNAGYAGKRDAFHGSSWSVKIEKE
jgi:hypothetical protein